MSAFVRATSTGDASRPELDALRGAAVLAVLFQHFADPHRARLVAALNTLPAVIAPWVKAVVSHAHVGVDLFFVLSGFTLALAWLRGRERGVVATSKHFFVRRATRLVPAYIVALVLVIALEPWQLAGASPTALALSLLTHLTFLQGYVAVGSIVLIGASWSLTTEVSFYLLFPWLAPRLLGAERRQAKWLALTIVIAAWALKAVLHEVASSRESWSGLLELSQWRFIGTRLDEFVSGMLLATLVQARPMLARRHTMTLLGAAALLFAVGARIEDAFYGRPGGGLPYVLVSLSVALFVYAVATAAPSVRRIFAPRPLVFIGVVSYGVFLLHQLVERFVRSALPCLPDEAALSHALVVAGLSLVGSVVLGAASFVMIERPLLERRNRPVHG